MRVRYQKCVIVSTSILISNIYLGVSMESNKLDKLEFMSVHRIMSCLGVDVCNSGYSVKVCVCVTKPTGRCVISACRHKRALYYLARRAVLCSLDLQFQLTAAHGRQN